MSTQLRLMSASLDAPPAVTCLFGCSSFKFRPNSAADFVVQTTTESSQSPWRDRRLSTPTPVRSISLKLRTTPAAIAFVKTATKPLTNLFAALPDTPQAPAPTNLHGIKTPHAPPPQPAPKIAARTPPRITYRSGQDHRSSPTTTYTTVLLRLPPISPILPAVAATAKSPHHADATLSVVAATMVATTSNCDAHGA